MSGRFKLSTDRERLVASAVAAILLHALIFAFVPWAATPERTDREPPMYVALDPVAPEPEPTEPAPTEPERPDREPEPPAPTPDPPAEPTDDEVPAETARPPGARRPEAQAERPASEPAAPDSANDDGARARPEASQTDAAERTPPSDPPAPPEFVESPPPPPPPPRTRVTENIRGDFAEPAASNSTQFVEAQISELYDWQERYRDEIQQWEERQAARDRSAEGPTDRATDESARADTVFANQLDQLIEGIRRSSNNVVEASPDASADDTRAGDGSGIAIDGTTGARARTGGRPIDLSDLSLGAGFPREYPVQVRFRVDAAGRVVSATVFPPTPEPALDRAIEDAISTWRFEPAGESDAPVVRGSATIIVSTR